MHNRSEKFSRGRWRVERERFHIADKRPGPSFHEAEALSGPVAHLMKRLGLGDQMWLEELAKAWPTLVGADVARHTRPGRMSGRNLTVFVDSSTWLSELCRHGQDRILANVQNTFGEERVSSISLQLDPDAPSHDGASGFLARWKRGEDGRESKP